MAVDVSRRTFVQGSAAIGGGLAIGGPLSALAANTAQGAVPAAAGYGKLFPTVEIETGQKFLALPRGFRYRLINKSGDPMRDGSPTPGIFDGMGAFKGPKNTTVLIRNHENRSRPGEITVPVPTSKRYDPNVEVRGGNTKLVVGPDRKLQEVFGVLGGTHTNCAGGETPWGTWISCEEIFNYGANSSSPSGGVPHGYAFEIPADATKAVTPQPIVDAGRFAREAVAWLDGVLYQTEDRGDACLYRFVPAKQPKEYGDLADFGGELQALVVKGQPNFDANLANPGDTFDVEWVTIDEPNPLTDTVRQQAQAKGAAIFDRTEGAWATKSRVYFDCTTGGEAQLGQLWEIDPDRNGTDKLKLILESDDAAVLENPDNVNVVPATGDVFLQEDSAGEQFVRGVTPQGRIYDFAKGLLTGSEFCGGCFSADGKTFFVNHQGERLATGETPETQPIENRGLTFAIWGPWDVRGA